MQLKMDLLKIYARQYGLKYYIDLALRLGFVGFVFKCKCFIFHDIFKCMIFQKRQKALLWSKRLKHI